MPPPHRAGGFGDRFPPMVLGDARCYPATASCVSPPSPPALCIIKTVLIWVLVAPRPGFHLVASCHQEHLFLALKKSKDMWLRPEMQCSERI